LNLNVKIVPTRARTPDLLITNLFLHVFIASHATSFLLILKGIASIMGT
jgi:hypothetical protein